MLDQVSLLSKGAFTNLALVWLFAQMHSDVVFEVPFLFEDLASPWNFANNFLYLSASFGIGKVLDLIRMGFEQLFISFSVLVGV